jgi:thiamine pyrophosphate-dependent acetolactate synthase large subunit-like protein
MLERPDGLRAVSDHYADDPVLLTLGGTIREMLSVVGRRMNHLYLLDAMGQPAAIGLGLALGLGEASRYDKVVVVEGDGSLLMGLSSIATIGHLAPPNLVLIVFDNGVYLATGGQPTAAASADYAAIALACGWGAARDIDGDLDDFREGMVWADSQPGPVLLRVKVTTNVPATDFYLADPVVLASEFTTWLHRSDD